MAFQDGLTEEQLRDFYDEYRSLAGTNATMKSFLAYIEYLKFNVLITYSEDTHRFQLTYAGYYFLQYLEEQNMLGDYKPL